MINVGVQKFEKAIRNNSCQQILQALYYQNEDPELNLTTTYYIVD